LNVTNIIKKCLLLINKALKYWSLGLTPTLCTGTPVSLLTISRKFSITSSLSNYDIVGKPPHQKYFSYISRRGLVG
jgi:hypothetical protein